MRLISLEDGSILSGEDAPRHKDLEKFMEDNPGFVLEQPMDTMDVEEEISMALDRGRRKRRPRVDPHKLDLDNLTGDENVSVINRETGKKVCILSFRFFQLRGHLKMLKSKNIFTSVQTVHFFMPPPSLPPYSLYTNILGFRNKGLMQHNIYCATTKINLASKPF